MKRVKNRKSKNNIKNLTAVVLAAGKGKRMKTRLKNKVAFEVGGVPMIVRTLNILAEAHIKNIVVVVGYARESVLKLLDKGIKTAYQRKGLGTGDAVRVALKEISPRTQDVLVLYGDDSFFYSPKILEDLYILHKIKKSKISFVTIELDYPTGLGRVVRGKSGKIVSIVEEKDATESERSIKEINPACYLFDAKFLRENIDKIPKSPITGEYYLTSLIHLAFEEKIEIETLRLKNFHWRGVNTPGELAEAERIIKRVSS